MSARQSPEVGRALRLIAQGMGLRAAAAKVGVHPSTLVRARQRHGLPALVPGRRAKA